MILRNIFKYIKRKAVTNTLFCLLLVLPGVLTCVAIGLFSSSYIALRDIDSYVTTIAIPDTFAINQYAQNYLSQNGITEYETEESVIKLETAGRALFYDLVTPYIEQDVLKSLRDTVYSSGLFKMDERRIFGASAEGIDAVMLKTDGRGHEATVSRASAQSMAAFDVTCVSVTTEYWVSLPDSYMWREDPDSSEKPYFHSYKKAVFSVNEVICLNSVYDRPHRLEVTFNLSLPDGSAPVEEGGRYIITGYGYTNQGQLFLEIENWNSNEVQTGVINHPNELDLFVWRNLKNWYFLYDEDLPMDVHEFVAEEDPKYSVYKIDNDSDGNYLSLSEEGRKKLKDVQLSYNSFLVLTSNDPNSIYPFNQKRNFVAKGRRFTPEEAESGAKVCLVSETFAAQNNLSVGDTLNMRIYPAMLSREIINAEIADTRRYVDRVYWIQYGTDSTFENSVTAEYNIVGIYKDHALLSGDYAVNNNTVVVPDKSIGDMESRISEMHPLLTDAIIVPNNGINAATEALDGMEEGYGRLFKFYDQGYRTLSNALTIMRSGMAYTLVLSTLIWVVVVYIFMWLFTAQKRKELLILYNLGVDRRDRFRWAFVQYTFMILLAQGIALAISLPSYGTILNSAAQMAENFTVSFRNLQLSDGFEVGVRGSLPLNTYTNILIISAAAQALILLITSWILTARSIVFDSLSAGKGEG